MAGIHTINIEQLIKSMTREHDHGWSRSEGGEPKIVRPQIYRTDKNLRHKHKNAYEPIMLSVGPYNHGIPSVHAMQMTKYDHLDRILNFNPEKSLPNYLEAMIQLEKSVKICYANEITLDRSNFVKMLLLDGCFVLVSILGIEWYIPNLQEPEEASGRLEVTVHKAIANSALNEKLTQDQAKLEIIQSNTMREDNLEETYYLTNQMSILDLWHDILLLENQIPFFVISKLYELTVGGSSMTTTILTEKIVEFVEAALHCYPKAIQKHNRPKEFFHLLHLCHMYFKPHTTATESCDNQVKPPQFQNLLWLGSNLFSKYKASSIPEGQYVIQQAIPSHRATEYHKAGIDFKKRKYFSENPHSLLDIVFCNGTIEIPRLTIDPNTQTLFCNLLTFEQTCPQFGNYVTAYIIFFCNLIRMSDDVSLLTKRGIIVHQLNGDAKVCDLFRMISECAFSDFNGDNYLKPLCSEIEAHYQNRRPVLRKLLSSITSKVHGWTQTNESS